MKKEEKSEILKKAYKKAMKELNKKTCKDIIESFETKPELNGQDLGTISLLSIFNIIRQQRKKPFITISQELENKYIKTIPLLSKKDKVIFDGYRYMGFWLSTNYALSLAQIQQRTGKLNYIKGRLRDIFLTETARSIYTNDLTFKNKETFTKQMQTELNDFNEQKKTTFKKYFELFSLSKYMENKKVLENFTDGFIYSLKSYKYLVGFNKLMELMAEYYNLPDLNLFAYPDINYLPEEFSEYNSWLKICTNTLKLQDYLKPEEQKGKIDFFVKNFKPINYDYEIPKAKIDKIKNMFSLEDFSPFYDSRNDLINIICYDE